MLAGNRRAELTAGLRRNVELNPLGIDVELPWRLIVRRGALGQGRWRTGDTGRLDEAGYLRVTGRIKDTIIRGGFNISAREVEETLLGVPAVTAAAVIGLPDPTVGERACAVIELAQGHDGPGLVQVRDYLTGEQGLAVWKVPERLEIVETWPVTATGKVQKYVLRGAYRDWGRLSATAVT